MRVHISAGVCHIGTTDKFFYTRLTKTLNQWIVNSLPVNFLTEKLFMPHTFYRENLLCFSLSFWNIDAPTRKISFLEEFCSNNNPGFFFSCNNSRVFKILSGNFKIACAKLKFPSDSFQSFRTILKTREMLQVKKKSGSFGTKCWGKLIPQRQSMLQKKRENIIFLPLEKVFKIKPGWKAHSRNPGKKVVKKTFFPTWLWSDFGK